MNCCVGCSIETVIIIATVRSVFMFMYVKIRRYLQRKPENRVKNAFLKLNFHAFAYSECIQYGEMPMKCQWNAYRDDNFKISSVIKSLSSCNSIFMLRFLHSFRLNFDANAKWITLPRSLSANLLYYLVFSFEVACITNIVRRQVHTQ